MKKNFKYGIPLLIALSLSVIPFNVSKAETIEEKDLVTYDAPDFDQLLLDDSNNIDDNLKVTNNQIENDKFMDEGDNIEVNYEQNSNNRNSNENIVERDEPETIKKYEDNENENDSSKPRNKKIDEKISNMTLDEKIVKC